MRFISIPTPCVGICRLDAHGICVGCGRTIRQIAEWEQMPEAERARIWAMLPPNHAAARPADGERQGACSDQGEPDDIIGLDQSCP